MKPFDDSIPEEIDTRHIALVSMLRQASPSSTQLTPEQQARIIERASQRLLSNDQAIAGDRDETEQLVGVASSNPALKPHPFAPRRGRRITQFASMLAAVLVIAALISASLLLFQHRQAQTIGVHPPANMVTVSSSAGDLEMSLSLTPGPYFLSELLAADISLTNHTDKTVYAGIPFVGSACGYATGVLMTSAGGPNYSIPIPTDHSCPPIANSTPLQPGQTLTVQKYLPLTSSGHVTLTAEAVFYTSGPQPQTPFSRQTSSPLEGHWPSMQIDVASKVPANRMISYHRDGTRVFINAPTDAQHLLQYLYSVSCQDLNDQGSTESGNYGWQALQKNVVGEPGCPGKNVHWAFAFGLPGYAIVQGSVTFPGNSPNP